MSSNVGLDTASDAGPAASDRPNPPIQPTGCAGGCSRRDHDDWSGDDPSSLLGVGNLGGRESAIERELASDRELEDQHVNAAPVGSYWANPFGLHDVLGNVWEWCADSWESYELPPAPGTGLRTGEARLRIGRGGGYTDNHVDARSASRYASTPYTMADVLGVRPARALRP